MLFLKIKCVTYPCEPLKVLKFNELNNTSKLHSRQSIRFILI